MHILGIDTSSAKVSVAISEGNAVHHFVYRDPPAKSSRDILPLIHETLDAASLRLTQIDLFAVAVGPGSFTGLRIGVGTALGFGGALGRPVTGAGSLDAIAYADAGWTEGRLCAVIQARRGAVYAALFGKEAGTISKLTGDREIAPDALAGLIDGPVRFAGDGYAPYARLFQERIPHPVSVAGASLQPGAVGVVLFACERLRRKDIDNYPPSPRYVSPSQAEVNRRQLQSST